jgi:serine/threonine-protein kinase
MPPEQATGKGEAVGPATDIYALGATLYCLITGRPPFQAATVMDTLMQVVAQAPVPLRQLNARVPRDLETICLKALAKEPHQRYPTAGEMADDLRRFLNGQPIKARPIGPTVRFWRWCRRNPVVAALGASLICLLVMVSSGSVLSNVWIRREQSETRRQFERAEENARLQQLAAAEARNAEKRAEESAAIAGDQRKLALDTLYDLVTRVEDKLRDKEGMNDLRQELLQTAMAGLGKVSKHVETAKVVDRSMGVALQRMADNYEQLGKTAEAERLYKSSLAIFSRLRAQEPQNDWIPWNQAVSFDKLGSFSQDFHGDSAAALAYYEKSLALRQELAAHPHAAEPPIPPARRKIAVIVSYIKLGSLTSKLGDPARADEYARQGLEECDAILSAAPADRTALQFRAMCCYLLGSMKAHLRAPDDARRLLGQSLELRREAVARDPVSAGAKRELGAVYDALGDLEVEQRNPQSALEHYGRAVTLYDELCKKERDNAEDQWYLAAGHYRQGAAMELLGKSAAAAEEFTNSLKLREHLVKTDPRNVQFQTERMLCLARLGRHAEAGRTAEELCKRATKNPAVLLSAARAYALCSKAVGSDTPSRSDEGRALRRRYTDKAFETIGLAISLGYRDVMELELDSALAPLRDYAEYSRLLELQHHR